VASGSSIPNPSEDGPVKSILEYHLKSEDIDFSDYRLYNPFSGYADYCSRETLSLGKDSSKPNANKASKFIYPNQDIDFDKYKSQASEYAERLLSSGWEALLPKENFLARHIAFCKTKLEIWENFTQGSKCLSKEEILYCSLTEGPAFAKYIKKARDYNHINKFSVTKMVFEEEYLFEDHTHADSLPSTDDLIFWTEKSDDIEWMFTEVDKLPNAKKAFKYHFKRYLEYIKVPREDVLEALKIPLESTLGNSKLYVPGENKTVFNKTLLPKYEDVEEGYYGKRTVIQVGPANCRDVVIPDGDTKFKVKMIDRIFTLIAKQDSWALSPPGIDKIGRIKKVLRCNLFIHLDLKKEGLTFPRYLIVAAAEVLEEIFDINLNYIKDFEDLFIEIDNTTYETKRGRSLGWGNQACTVIVSCLIQSFLWSLNEKSEKYFGVVYTDDIIIGTFTSDERYQGMHSVEVIALLNEFLSTYGFIVGYKKCYASRSPTILGTTYSKDEQVLFYDQWGRRFPLQPHKNTYSVADKWRMFSKAIHARNHEEAKFFVNAVLLGFNKNLSVPKDFALKIACSWGKEFKGGPDEWDVPFRGGGWYTPIDENLDSSYDNIDDLKYIASFREIDEIVFSIPCEQHEIKEVRRRRKRRILNAQRRNAFSNEDMKEALAESDSNFVSLMAAHEMKPLKNVKGTAFWNADKLFREKFNILSVDTDDLQGESLKYRDNG
jgi:hypothetical protein